MRIAAVACESTWLRSRVLRRHARRSGPAPVRCQCFAHTDWHPLFRRPVHDIGPVWDDEVLADPEVQAAIRDNGTVRREYVVTNQDRSALGRIGGAVARVHGAPLF